MPKVVLVGRGGLEHMRRARAGNGTLRRVLP